MADLPAGRQARTTQNMYSVYVIKSLKRNYIYVGITNNLLRRFNQHNNGLEKTTKPYSPFRLLFTEKFAIRRDARARKKYLKSGVGEEWIKKIK